MTPFVLARLESRSLAWLEHGLLFIATGYRELVKLEKELEACDTEIIQ